MFPSYKKKLVSIIWIGVLRASAMLSTFFSAIIISLVSPNSRKLDKIAQKHALSDSQ